MFFVKNLLNLRFFLSIISICSLTAIGFTQTDVELKTLPKVRKSAIKNFDLKEGVYLTAFELSDGSQLEVKISVPKIKPQEEVPLILALHWAGAGNTYQEFFDCLALPGLDTLNAIIIAPSSQGMYWTNQFVESWVISIVNHAKKHWPINTKEVIICGYSMGAVATWHFAKKYPKIFTHGIALGGSYEPGKIKIPMHVVHGAEDELFLESDIKKAIDQSINKGSEVHYTVLPNMTHRMACAFANVLQEIALSIHAH